MTDRDDRGVVLRLTTGWLALMVTATIAVISYAATVDGIRLQRLRDVEERVSRIEQRSVWSAIALEAICNQTGAGCPRMPGPGPKEK